MLRRRFGSLPSAIVDAVARRVAEPDCAAFAADVALATSLDDVERLLSMDGR
jgi:hypothetical protein